MATTWVLHTETKGTGAQMVPLESVKKRSSGSSTGEPVPVPRKPRRAHRAEPSKPREPRKFKIVDVMTRQALTEDATTQEAVDELKGVRSVVDVNIYVWQHERDRWRMLTFAEQRALLELAHSDVVATALA
jgi:hypothetical protein